MCNAPDLAYRSLRLNSNSAIAPTIAAWTEMIMGNPGKAIELYHHADRLSPRDPRGWLIATSLGLAHFYEGRFGEAKSCAEKALVHNPRFADAQNEPRNGRRRAAAEGACNRFSACLLRINRVISGNAFWPTTGPTK